MSDASCISLMEDVMYLMYVFGLFGFVILVGFIQVLVMFYDSLHKPLSYLKKEHYNMKTVRELRMKFSRFVREDERHLYL